MAEKKVKIEKNNNNQSVKKSVNSAISKKTTKKKASFKLKKVYARKPKLSEINMLNILVVVVPREKEVKASNYIVERGGVILSKNRAKGVSRSSIFSGIGANETPVSCLFAMARSEDAPELIVNLSNDFRLDIPGNGKAFLIDVLGYMGAKAPFIEKRLV